MDNNWKGIKEAITQQQQNMCKEIQDTGQTYRNK